LTQAFFQELIEKDWVARADRSKTKFRTFLLTHFKYVLSNEYRMQQADKRGGQIEHLAFDFEDADERFQSLAAEGSDPTVAYDRAWAERVVDQTLALLRREYEHGESSLPFDRLRSFLPGGAGLPKVGYPELEAQYGRSVDAIKQRVSRLNKRFRELLVSVVADTVADPSQVDEELKSLVAALTA
jgi:RNA polymerase sigma-70 factor (ECF subfamily)